MKKVSEIKKNKHETKKEVNFFDAIWLKSKGLFPHVLAEGRFRISDL